ncbi:hypothetical protein C6N75_17220, partial [Streptomyces solincola]
AALGERADIRAYGIMSDQATRWLITRATVADLSGDHHTAAQLRATVARMGKEWYDSSGPETTWYGQVEPPPASGVTALPEPASATMPTARRFPRRYAVAAAALSLAILGIWQYADQSERTEARQDKAKSYVGKSAAGLTIDGVPVRLTARWTRDRDHVIIQLESNFNKDARHLLIAGDARTVRSTAEDGSWPRPPRSRCPLRTRWTM